MSGASFTSELDLHEARAAFARLTDDQLRQLVDNIGEMIETQTKQRIQTEKSSPDGEAWAPWSAEYARLRSGGHSLLENEGHLLTSIANLSSGMEAIVGTDVPYGATHQFGRDGIPARPYLGLSGENREEIERPGIGQPRGVAHMTALLLIATGLFVGLVQALLMAVLGQEISEGNRSKSRAALVMGATAYLLSAGLFLAAGAQLAARL